jgi:hypothetical protein
MNRTFALAAMLVIGCVAGATTAQLVVPQARARTGSARWEYTCKRFKPDHTLLTNINLLGDDGWELVTANSLTVPFYEDYWGMCFKRPST